MKLRRTLKFHSLKRGRVRQTWNKHNLFNLTKVEKTIPNFIWRTFFQQKWTAKALTRAYHGEHIKERKWERMFSRRMLSVVNMDPVYMAHNDGSEQAAGRGSGKEKPRFEDVTPWHERGQVTRKQKPGMPYEPDLDLVDVDVDARVSKQEANVQQFTGQTPYMSMAYAPLERRIDVAIFRALFASSTRQARQFVIHGAVKVNGQVMRHPSYLLNPGDMFQVQPESVLFATGKKKPSENKGGGEAAQKGEDGGEEAEAEDVENLEAEEAAVEVESPGPKDVEAISPVAAKVAANGKYEGKYNDHPLVFLTKQAKYMLKQQKGDLRVKQKQRFRDFIKASRAALSRAGRPGGGEAVASDKLVVDEINSMLRELIISNPNIGARAQREGAFTAEEVSKASEPAEKEETQVEKKEEGPEKYLMSDAQVKQMNEVLRKWEENPADDSKPYLTPWEPRRYMSAFAYIPRYLEVNQNICAAVYLRHPVARQRYAEVPTPFPPPVMQLAFNWYLRRR